MRRPFGLKEDAYFTAQNTTPQDLMERAIFCASHQNFGRDMPRMPMQKLWYFITRSRLAMLDRFPLPPRARMAFGASKASGPSAAPSLRHSSIPILSRLAITDCSRPCATDAEFSINFPGRIGSTDSSLPPPPLTTPIFLLFRILSSRIAEKFSPYFGQRRSLWPAFIPSAMERARSTAAFASPPASRSARAPSPASSSQIPFQ